MDQGRVGLGIQGEILEDAFLSYQRYPKQILGDDKVLAMDWDVRGMHNWLLDISWQQSPRGTIPADHAVLRRWLGSPSDETWRRIWSQLSPAWPSLPDGRLGNNGMLKTAEKKENYHNGNKNKGANKSQTGSQITRKPPENDKEKILDSQSQEKLKPKNQEPIPEFNGEMWTRAILASHPRAEWSQLAVSFLLDAIESEAKERGWDMTTAAEYVHERTKLYAQIARTKGTTANRAMNGAKSFYQGKIYRQDESVWKGEEPDGNFKSKTEQRSAHNSETARRTLELIERKANPVHVHGDSGGDGGGAAQPTGDPGVFFRSGKFKPGRDSEAVEHLPADEEIVR